MSMSAGSAQTGPGVRQLRRRRFVTSTVCAGALGFLAMAAAAPAQPIRWSANGHYYELIKNQVNWTQARDAAAVSTYLGLPGRLVTISSAEENAFVVERVAACEWVWIGLSDAALEGTFAWVNGEPLGYTNWYTDEPNNYDNEDYTELVAACEERRGFWNDVSNDYGDGRYYVVEYGTETGQIPLPAGPALPPGVVWWQGNGSYYQLVSSQVSWTEARDAAAASSIGARVGHLVTIASAEENAFILENATPCDRVWIGLSDAGVEGTFAWVTGEPLGFTNWAGGEPNGDTDENYGELNGSCGDGRGRWNDLTNTSGGGRYYVIEYDQLPAIPVLTRTAMMALALALLAGGVRRLS